MTVPRFGLNRFDSRSQPDSQLRRRDTYVLLADAARSRDHFGRCPDRITATAREPTRLSLISENVTPAAQ